MKILAFDTSNSTLSVALCEDDKPLQTIVNQDSGKQAEQLLPMIEKILQDHNLTYQDLDLIAVTKGPGSFTGVRIGLACAKSIEIATNLPLIALDSLETLAQKIFLENADLLVAVDAKIDEFFVREFVIHNYQIIPKTDSRLINLDEFQELSKKYNLVCGNVFDKNDIITADLVAKLAYKKFHEGSSEGSNPAYLRMPKITARKN